VEGGERGGLFFLDGGGFPLCWQGGEFFFRAQGRKKTLGKWGVLVFVPGGGGAVLGVDVPEIVGGEGYFFPFFFFPKGGGWPCGCRGRVGDKICREPGPPGGDWGEKRFCLLPPPWANPIGGETKWGLRLQGTGKKTEWGGGTLPMGGGKKGPTEAGIVAFGGRMRAGMGAFGGKTGKEGRGERGRVVEGHRPLGFSERGGGGSGGGGGERGAGREWRWGGELIWGGPLLPHF